MGSLPGGASTRPSETRATPAAMVDWVAGRDGEMSEVVFIGTSDAFGAGGRRQSAVLVRGSRGTALLDCGMTTNTGLNELAVERDEIETILLSHFHADHFGGRAARSCSRRKLPRSSARVPLLHRRPARRRAARASGWPDAMGHPIAARSWASRSSFSRSSRRASGFRSSAPCQRRVAFETHHQPEAHPHGYPRRARRRHGQSTRATLAGSPGSPSERQRQPTSSSAECTYEHRAALDFHLSHEELVERTATSSTAGAYDADAPRPRDDRIAATAATSRPPTTVS